MQHSADVRAQFNEAFSSNWKAITINVGHGATTQSFALHESIISARSEFFRRALNGNWAPSQTGVITLRDTNPAIFSLYANLIYTGKIPTETASSSTDVSPEFGFSEAIARYCELYVLSEMLQDSKAKKTCIAAILAECNDAKYKTHFNEEYFPLVPLAKDVRTIYEGTPGPCRVRKLLVSLYNHRAYKRYIEENYDEFPGEFLKDLLMSLVVDVRCCGPIRDRRERRPGKECEMYDLNPMRDEGWYTADEA
jgi:hypothetical protein